MSRAMQDEQIDKLVGRVINALRSIAHGDLNPGGLEGVSVAIAGEYLRRPLSASIDELADAVARIATDPDGQGGLDGVALAIRHVGDPSLSMSIEAGSSRVADAINVLADAIRSLKGD